MTDISYMTLEQLREFHKGVQKQVTKEMTLLAQIVVELQTLNEKMDGVRGDLDDIYQQGAR